MPYQTNIPNAAQSPGLFPAQANDNFTRLKTIVGANHKFNDSAAVDDGYHQNIKMLPLAVPGNDASVGQSFVNSADATNQLWFKDGINRVFQVTPTIPIYAAVNFEATAPPNIRFGFNILSVVRESQGIYRINFARTLPSNNYVVSGVCMSTGNTRLLMVETNATYANSMNVNFVRMRIFNLSDSNSDALMCSVLVSGG